MLLRHPGPRARTLPMRPAAGMALAAMVALAGTPAPAQTDLMAAATAPARPAPSAPAPAAGTAASQTVSPAIEARLRTLEAQLRAVQRKVFPDGAGRTFAPEITPAEPAPSTAVAVVPNPEPTPLADVLNRLGAIEAQVRQLTAASEDSENRLTRLDKRVGTLESAAAAAAAAATPPPPEPTPDPAAAAPRAGKLGGRPPAGPTTTGAAKPRLPATPVPAPAANPDRVAAVAAIVHPATGDAAEDQYLYGFHLFEAHFYPEAAHELAAFVDQNPHHAKISLARNLLGRAYLEDDKPGTAAKYFLENYRGDPKSARAGDSLLWLGVAMARLNETRKACQAFAQFRSDYPDLRSGRLRGAYDNAVKGVTCD